jgi:hypothetical protein
VLRALIAVALLTGVATHFLSTPPAITLGYVLVLCATLWFTWPAARWAGRLMRRARRRRSPRRTAPNTPTPAPHLTQINHHHYYGSMTPPTTSMPPPQQPDHTLPALPQQSRQQIAHDAIYDTTDPDDSRP